MELDIGQLINLVIQNLGKYCNCLVPFVNRYTEKNFNTMKTADVDLYFLTHTLLGMSSLVVVKRLEFEFVCS